MEFPYLKNKWWKETQKTNYIYIYNNKKERERHLPGYCQKTSLE